MRLIFSSRLIIILLLSLALVNVTNHCEAQLHPQFAKRLKNYSQPKQYSLFVKGDVEKIKSAIKKINGTFKYAFGNIASINIPASEYDNFLKADWYESRQLSYYKGDVMDDQANINNNVNAVHTGTTPLPQAYDGTGVIVGILDYQLDFNHPDFKLANGHSRIKYLWNQHDTSIGAHPAPYGYGKDWDSSAINAGTITTYQPDMVYYGHGTLTTGTACGNSQQHSNYRAIAPNADIIFVGIDMQGLTGNSFESCVADGAAYVFAKAAALGKPCVINTSIGTYAGSHDGTDLATQAIENLLAAQGGRSLVAAAGNAGGKPIHLGYTIPTNDSAYTFFKTFSAGGMQVMYFELFSDYANWNNAQFAVGADYTSPYTHLPRTNFMNVLTDYQMSSQTTYTRYDTIKNAIGQRLGVMESYCEKQNGHYFMYFGVIADSVTNYVWRFMTKGSGKLDVWSHPSFTGTSQMLNSGLPTVAQLPDMSKYILPDTEQTIVGDWNCSAKVISVANYLNRNNYTTWQGNNFVCSSSATGSRALSSSKGPTRTGLQKPDIAATGDRTLAADDFYWINWAKTGNPNGISSDTLHGPHNGTSAAAPTVSGVVALYFQKYPTANWADVKASVTTCVKTDNFTGNNLPDYDWGYGKIDAFKVLNCKGCTNPSSTNYNPYSQINDGSCILSYPTNTTIHSSKTFICTGDTVQFSDSIGSAFVPTQWFWTFGSGTFPVGSTLPSPKVVFNTAGQHVITLVIANAGGSGTFTDTVTVVSTPLNSFSLISQICQGSNDIVTYTGNATAGASYNWTFNGASINGSGQGPYQVSWVAIGNKIVSLQVSENGCASTIASQNVNVEGLPIIHFTYHLMGSTATFINNTSGATAYAWYFGDGGTSAQNSPSHTYTTNNTFIVTLNASSGLCSSSDTMNVKITGALGIENIVATEDDFFVFNNHNSTLEIQWNKFSKPRTIELINLNGQVIYTSNLLKENYCSVDIANLPATIYLVRSIDVDGNVINKKWIKN